MGAFGEDASRRVPRLSTDTDSLHAPITPWRGNTPRQLALTYQFSNRSTVPLKSDACV